MCTILIAHQMSEQRPLLVLANRDEFYSRPTAAMAEWHQMPGLIAGRDLASGGTWFGARKKRWASVTNIREGARDKNDHGHQKSRGWLVLDYLQSELSAGEYLHEISVHRDAFAGYNLLLGEANDLWYASNRTEQPICLKPGVYGLSNHLLDTPWPKVRKGKKALEKIIQQGPIDDKKAFAILTDTSLAEDEELPDTGVPYEWEKALSATFIKMPGYGTRCSTLLTIDQKRTHRLIERRYYKTPQQWEETEFAWTA